MDRADDYLVRQKYVIKNVISIKKEEKRYNGETNLKKLLLWRVITVGCSEKVTCH